MMWHIAKRELYDNLNSLRFRIGDGFAVGTDADQCGPVSA